MGFGVYPLSLVYYQWYGDDSALTKHYDAMKCYLRYLQSRADGGIVDYGLGDWYDMGPQHPGKAQLTSVALSATAMYYYDLTTMRKIAEHLGNDIEIENQVLRRLLLYRDYAANYIWRLLKESISPSGLLYYWELLNGGGVVILLQLWKNLIYPLEMAFRNNKMMAELGI